MQQHYLVAKRLNLTCPPVSASASLEGHSTRRALGQKCDQIVASEPAIGNLTGLCIDPVHLEYPSDGRPLADRNESISDQAMVCSTLTVTQKPQLLIFAEH